MVNTVLFEQVVLVTVAILTLLEELVLVGVPILFSYKLYLLTDRPRL